MLGSRANLITTVIGFRLSIGFIVFVCIRLICVRIRAVESTAAAATIFEAESRSEQDNSTSGLDPAFVAGFPTMKFNSEAFHSKEDAQCSICLGDYQEKEILRIMPTCGHAFHLTCIDTWLQKQSTCPVCRLSLPDSVEAKYMTSPMYNTILQSVDSSEVMTNNSNQWLIPTNESS